MKYSSEITEILSLALSGHTGEAATKLNLLISSMEYEGDTKTAKKLRKALSPKNRPAVAKPPKLYLASSAIDDADRFIKGIRMHDILEADGIEIPTVLSIWGPSGCGKTSLAGYIAAALSLPIAEGDSSSEPSEGLLLHICAELDAAKIRELASKDLVTIIESIGPLPIPDDCGTAMSIHLDLPGDEERKAYISDISGIDNISHSGMKILLELFKDASFRTIRQAAMDARRTAAFESVPVTFPMLAQAALPYIGIEDSRDGKANDAIRRKARILRERNPRVFSVQALADIFGKPKATMHYMLTN